MELIAQLFWGSAFILFVVFAAIAIYTSVTESLTGINLMAKPCSSFEINDKNILIATHPDGSTTEFSHSTARHSSDWIWYTLDGEKAKYPNPFLTGNYHRIDRMNMVEKRMKQ